MAESADTGRVIRSQKVELPDQVEGVDWTPRVLKGKTSDESLPMTLRETEVARSRPQEAPRKPTPAPSPQKPESVQPRPDADALAQPPIRKDESLEQIATRRPRDVARVVQTILHTEPKKHGDVGVLMVGLGSNLASGVLQHCSVEDVSTIAKVVADCQTVAVQEKDAVFEAIRNRLFEGEFVLQGGADFARAMLQKAMGPRRADMIMGRLDVDQAGFHLLSGVEPELLIPFLSKEHPQTIALILTQMENDQAADVLNRLDANLQGEVMYRIAQMNTVSPQVMRELEDRLSEELQAMLSGQITQLGGPIAAARILNQARQTTEKYVMTNLDERDAELAEKVRNQMFVFDDIASLTDDEIQLLLKEIDIRDWAIGLKGGSKELQERISMTASEDVVNEIKERMASSGPVRVSDVEEVQLKIVQRVRQLDADGQVIMMRRGSDVFI